MDASEQIHKFQEFLEKQYQADLLNALNQGKKFLSVDFSELINFDPELADLVLDEPDELIRASELAVDQIAEHAEKFHIRFKNLPDSQKIMIKDVRSSHLNSFLMIEGLVKQKSDVRPQVASAKFECPACATVLTVLQLDTKFKEPTRCSCGRKGRFKMLSKELVDAQGIVLEEIPERLEGGEQPKRLNIFLKDDLVSPISEKRTNPGSKIRVIGQIKEVPVILKTGGKSTRFDLILEANNVEAMEESFSELIISDEEEKQIKELSQDPKVFELLVESIAPSIYGYEEIKLGLLLQLTGGVQKIRTDGMVSRGDIHVLLVGDPGAGKSQLLKRISRVAPKARYVSGKGASGAGLTAAVVRDEFLGGWSLEAGALVLANNGICCIDELDKMRNEDRSAMHEALEQQTISISKANIQATLLSRTTVLAAANPKFGRFDPYEIIAKQIDLDSTLINRFDLIFTVKDLPSEEHDKKIAKHILGLHQNPNAEETEISSNFLKKYIAYARQKIFPILTESAIDELEDYYVKIRATGSTEGGVRSIPLSARQLEALIRLSEASAKVRLSDKVTKKDAKRAIDILSYCLMQVGYDRETGKLDIDRISTGISATVRSKITAIKEIIDELENKIGKTIPIDDVVREAVTKGINEREAEEVIEKLRKGGDIFEPRTGFIQKM